MHSLLGVPINVRGRAIGDLYMTDKQGAAEFSAQDERLIELFARHAGIAIENARLHERLAALRVVAERERIGRDLHDGVIQGLYGVTLTLEDIESMIADSPDEAVARVDQAIDAIHRSIGDIREFILGLRPGLDETDLRNGILALADGVRLTTTIHVETRLDAEAADLAGLDPRARGELIQLVREALSNVTRHSRASRLEIALARVGDDLVLEIADNGVGFDPTNLAPGRHHGLANLRDRAAAAGGRLEIDTRPAVGTRLVVQLPVVPEVTRS
jgi:signal transduction histidine kinase